MCGRFALKHRAALGLGNQALGTGGHCREEALADKVVAMGFAESISLETVRQILKKRTQAVEEEGVVHTESERGVRGSDGGRAGPVP